MLEESAAAPLRARSLARSLFTLARPQHWAKNVFILIGPFYGLVALDADPVDVVRPVALTVAMFALTSSAIYVVNDIADANADRLHPRKRNRPVASGATTKAQAAIFATLLGVFAMALLLAIPSDRRAWVGVCLVAYAGNAIVYSLYTKHKVIADVMSLSLGYVIRVLAGCAALSIVPTTWLLNSTFFLAMFLAFGKRLGERRVLATNLQAIRRVQALYTDTLLQLMMVATGVATLLGYAAYVESESAHYSRGFNLLWLTLLPAVYAMFRCMILLDRGNFDDVTEVALRDRNFQAAAAIFAAATILLYVLFRL